MKVVYLVRGESTRDEYANVALPDGVERTVGTYKAEGGDLYFVGFTMQDDTLENARVLATLRDRLAGSSDVRVLRDEASAMFCEHLYPHFCRFEKGLREAITVATCAVQGNFSDPKVVNLEKNMTLEALNGLLFIDGEFIRRAKSIIQGKWFTRIQIKNLLDNQPETIIWNKLFSENDMPTYRENHNEIKDRRNDVMHYHKMTEGVFEHTRDILAIVNGEIDDYLERVRNDVLFPKAKAEDAKIAAQIIGDIYDDLQESARAFSNIGNLIGLSDSLKTAASAASSYLAKQFFDQQAFDHLAAEVFEDYSNAFESARDAFEAIGFGENSAVMNAAESAMHALSEYPLSADSIADYCQQHIPPEVFDSIRVTASESMNIMAERFSSSSSAHALEHGDHPGDSENTREGTGDSIRDVSGDQLGDDEQ